MLHSCLQGGSKLWPALYRVGALPCFNLDECLDQFEAFLIRKPPKCSQLRCKS
jgi:hypothetical protein